MDVGKNRDVTDSIQSGAGVPVFPAGERDNPEPGRWWVKPDTQQRPFIDLQESHTKETEGLA